MKNIIFALIAIFMLSACQSNQPQDQTNHNLNTTVEAAHTQENWGNKTCPVTGEPIDNASTCSFEGKNVNFCCPSCVNKFEKNPEQYREAVVKK